MANEILGLIGKKIGMTQLFDKNAASRGVTIIELTPNTVLQVKTASTKDGYNAVQLAWGTRKDARATRAELGHFKKAGAATAGVMKRHNFSGFKASHGVHEYYRHGGSIGTRLTPGMTFKGKKMPGHMGDAKLTVQNLYVERIDAERNLLFVRGGVPGADGAVVAVRAAVKK